MHLDNVRFALPAERSAQGRSPRLTVFLVSLLPGWRLHRAKQALRHPAAADLRRGGRGRMRGLADITRRQECVFVVPPANQRSWPRASSALLRSASSRPARRQCEDGRARIRPAAAVAAYAELLKQSRSDHAEQSEAPYPDDVIHRDSTGRR